MTPPKSVLPNGAICIALLFAFAAMLTSIGNAHAAPLDSANQQAGTTNCATMHAAAILKGEDELQNCDTDLIISVDSQFAGATLNSPGANTVCVGKTANQCAEYFYDNPAESLVISDTPFAMQALHFETETHCVDGTAPMLYYSPGTVNNWLFYFEGENMQCKAFVDRNERGSGAITAPWESCWATYKSEEVIKTFGRSDRRPGEGILSTNSDISPFADWHHVHFQQCSNDQSMGDIVYENKQLDPNSPETVSRVWFQGKQMVLDAIDAFVEPANQSVDLSDADEVVFVGKSGGSQMLQYRLDGLANHIKTIAPTATVYGLADSGIFPSIMLEEAAFDGGTACDSIYEGQCGADYDSPEMGTDVDTNMQFDNSGFLPNADTGTLEYGYGMVRERHEAWNSHDTLDESCVAEHGVGSWECYDNAYTLYNHVETPIFIATSTSDTNVLKQPPSWLSAEQPPICWMHEDAGGAQGNQLLRERMSKQLIAYRNDRDLPGGAHGDAQDASNPDPIGVWAPNFLSHTLTTNNCRATQMRLGPTEQSSATLVQAFDHWMDGNEVFLVDGFNGVGLYDVGQNCDEKAAVYVNQCVGISPNEITTADELVAIQDAYVRSSSPNNGFGNGFTRIGQPSDQTGLIQFDLSVLPVNAIIDRAELQLTYTGAFTGSSNIEVGANTDPWEENNVTYSTKPNMVFGGPVQTVEDAPGVIRWTVTRLVDQWQSGAFPNYGFALRGDAAQKVFHAKETNANFAPRLRLVYTTPAVADEPRPDLGDAPDSSNHHNQPNTAYAGAGILGQFPTVYNVPANAVAGPRHDNLILEGYLGNVLSREVEADQDVDQDGPNNIIRDAAGVVADVADMDRGDDGWRNRNIRFFDCQKQTLTVRVSKAAVAATVEAPNRRMHLNVWFDGNRDGDWGDISLCEDPNGGPGEASYEWIVQNYLVDMDAIAAGDFFDFDIETVRVFNAGQQLPHWMRFILSDEPAVAPENSGNPDGRGPHPQSDQMSYRLGETEDVLYVPSPPGEDGELLIQKRVITEEEPVTYAGSVIYEIRVRHDGGTQPIEAHIRDELPYPMHLNRQIDDDGNIYLVDVSSATGGVSPLTAELEYQQDPQFGFIEQIVSWQGTLEPDSEIVLSFEVHIHPLCAANENTQTITNLAQARVRNEAAISAEALFEAACPGYTPSSIEIGEPTLTHLDPEDWSLLEWRGEVHNKHDQAIALGFVQQLGDSNTSDSRFLQRVELEPGEKRGISLQMEMDESLDGELTSTDDEPLGQLRYCILAAEDEVCPDPDEYPNVWGDTELPFVPRRADLGDAPDSTNHDGVAMLAYPTIQANFPTVFDPTTGRPVGPRHLRPWLFHLGPDVSNEVEADIGPDADGVNNIDPAGNVPDLDWFDDGAALTLQGNCQPALVDVEINVSPRAKQHFSGTNSIAYLNVWLDWSYDGDWDDFFPCTGPGGQSVNSPEHILIDEMIDVSALVTGTNIITGIVTSRVPWPTQFNERKRWVRFTLSDEESNKKLPYNDEQDQEKKYSDGRGYLTSFNSGETEDYLWDLRPNPTVGPDINIHFEADIHLERPTGTPNEVPRTVLDFKVNYANVGSQSAADAVLTISKSEALRNMEIIAVAGDEIDPDSVTSDPNTITVPLPTVPAGNSGSVLIRIGPVEDGTVAAAAHSLEIANAEGIEVSARVDVAGDLDESNNSSTIVVQQSVAPLRMAGVIADDRIPRKADATCRRALVIASKGVPLGSINLNVNGASTMQLQYDANGQIDNAAVTGLADGRNLIWIDYLNEPTHPGNVTKQQSIKLLVDPSLVLDPITLLITDSQGRQQHPSTLNWSAGGLDSYLMQLQAGETYTISINSCIADPNISAELLLNESRLTTLSDDDGDGRFSGQFIYDLSEVAGELQASNIESNKLRLVITANGVEESIVGLVEAVPSATVRDANTDQPIAGASVTVLLDGVQAALQGNNPQMTDAAGAYNIAVPEDSYQVLVTAGGYQPYRSQALSVNGGTLAQDVKVTPAITDAADHTIFITAQGYSPEQIEAKPGDVIEWINTDLDEHGINGDVWNSGRLAPLGRFKIQLDAEGVYPYGGDVPSFGAGSINVTNETENPDGGENPDGEASSVEIFLPVMQR